MALSNEQIDKLADPAERLYQKATNALHGQATIEASIVIRGGGLVVKTRLLRVVVTSPDIIGSVTCEDVQEWVVLRDLPIAYAKARRARDLDIFKREVVQRSGGAVSRELAEKWAETLLRTQPYTAYKDAKASYLSEAVAKHPANNK